MSLAARLLPFVAANLQASVAASFTSLQDFQLKANQSNAVPLSRSTFWTGSKHQIPLQQRNKSPSEKQNNKTIFVKLMKMPDQVGNHAT